MPVRAALLNDLGIVLHRRFLRTADGADLDKAVMLSLGAVAAVAATHPARAMLLSNLGGVLHSRSEWTGSAADLDEAIAVGRAAVGATAPDDPARARRLSNLGLSLRSRYERTSAAADLNESIAASRASVDATEAHDPARAGFLSNLGAVLHARFERTGDPSSLDEAVVTHRAAVDSTPAGSDRAEELGNLGVALRDRFALLGEKADLDEAIAANRAAVAARPTGHPDRGKYLSNLSAALGARFEEFGDVADSFEAVESARLAVEVTPPAHPARRIRLTNLGTALAVQFDRLGEPADLTAAIGAARAAVAASDGHPNRGPHLSFLGRMLTTRFDRFDEPADLDEAAEVAHAAVAATPGDDPQSAYGLGIRARVLRTRYERGGQIADVQAALRALRQAATAPTAAADTRMIAGLDWGKLAASEGRWADATDGFATAVQLLPLVAWRGAERTDRERRLAGWAGGTAHAAACAIAANQPDRAVELLEQGRGVLWSQLLESRTDLTALREEAPELADRLDALRAELDRPVDTDTSPVSLIDRRMALAREWDSLLDRVRARPGFHDFARVPPVARLRRAAADGTVVVVTASTWRCDAILITATSVRVVPLPTVALDAVAGHAERYLRTLSSDPAARDLAAVGQVPRDHGPEHALTETLRWLWDTVAEPVLTALGHDRTPAAGRQWPRLWWYPTGPFTVLPLHAAGNHDRDGGSAGRSVLDRVVSSYTPTLRTLAEARARPGPTAPGRMLFIALPDTPGQPPLPAIERERALLAGLLGPERQTVLAGADATRSAILRTLAEHPWVHASCHGVHDLDDPASGGLVPYDWQDHGRVSVTDLSGSDVPAGEFVFLSACKTAISGRTNTDEVIHPAAALHYTGWRHVVATLWSVWDTAAADLTANLYPRLVHAGRFDPGGTALALHHAVRDCRQRHPDQPSRWAPFLHIGP